MDINSFMSALTQRLVSAGADREAAAKQVNAFISSMPEEEALKLASLGENEDMMHRITDSLIRRIGTRRQMPADARGGRGGENVGADDIDDEDETFDEMLDSSMEPQNAPRQPQRPREAEGHPTPQRTPPVGAQPRRRPQAPGTLSRQPQPSAQTGAPQQRTLQPGGAGAPQRQPGAGAQQPGNIGAQRQPGAAEAAQQPGNVGAQQRQPGSSDVAQQPGSVGAQPRQPGTSSGAQPRSATGVQRQQPQKKPLQRASGSSKKQTTGEDEPKDRRMIYKPDPNADYHKFYTIFACTSPIWGFVALLGAAAFLFAVGALSVSIVLLIVGIFVGVAVGTTLSLVGIIYGITQLFEYVPIGMYEIGLGIMIGGFVMLIGILAYNTAIRLIPYLIKQIMVLLSFTIHKCIELYYYVKGRCADL